MTKTSELSSLTLHASEVVKELSYVPCGVFAHPKADSQEHILIVKASKEVALTVKERQGFKIYVFPIAVEDFRSYGLVSAFFDDADEPLAMFTPLITDDFACEDILSLLQQENCDVFFFDENNRELLSYRAQILDPTSQLRSLLNTLELEDLVDPTPEFSSLVVRELQNQFGHRTREEDHRAFNIKLGDPLFPETLLLMDTRPQVNSYHGRKTIMTTVLERKKSGEFNELDIVQLLLRTFSSEQVFLNPQRCDNRRELVDHLVVTDCYILLVQAKDSPNTKDMIDREIDRKRSTTLKHLEKGMRQLRGTISYLKESSKLNIEVCGKEHEIDLQDREIYGLVVAGELFDDEYARYSRMAFDTFYADNPTSCVFLDYADLHNWTHHLSDESSFFRALDKLIFEGLSRYGFLRIRFLPESEP